MKNRYCYTLSDLREKYTEAANLLRKYREKPADLMLFKPAPGAWSAQEICQHLVEFDRLYLQQIDKAISHTSPIPQGDGTFCPRWHFSKLAGLFEPPYTLKLKTLPLFTPGDDRKVLDTLDNLADIQENVLNILDQTEAGRWNLDKVKGKNPALRIISMTISELLIIMEVHQRRHFWQIQKTFELFGAEKPA